MKLSILIPTIPERIKEFTSLMDYVSLQAKGLPVEIISDDAPRGTISIGYKRNALYDRAKGTHAVCIDDDDSVPRDYVVTILEALESDPDCVGHFELVEGMGPLVPRLAKWTNKASGWKLGAPARIEGVEYIRTPFNKTPIRTSIVRTVRFGDMGFGEDEDFSRRLKKSGLCKTEVFIPRVMYYYRYIHTEDPHKYGK